jgi:hypothetical protein
MKTFTNRIKANFTAIPNTILNDVNLSWKAKGIFSFLASKPDTWQFSMAYIVKQATGGKSSLQSGIKELEEAGYLRRERMYDENRQFKGYMYILEEGSKTRQTENPVAGKSGCRKTVLHSNTDISNTDISNTNTNYQGFVDFWNELYQTNYKLTDKKKGQINARLQTFTKQEIGEAIRNRHEDAWLNTEGKDYLSSWDAFWRSDDKVDRYLNRADEDELPF